MKSPLLDFRERSVKRSSFAYGIFTGASVVFAAVAVARVDESSGALAVLLLIAAKYAHAKIPKKRRQKQVPEAHPELPL